MSPSHVMVVGSPGAGKTYYLLNNFRRSVYVSFVPYSSFGEHFKSMIKKGRRVMVLIVDDLGKIPVFETGFDIVFLDCSSYRGDSELEQFIIDIMLKNKRYYSTLIIDEVQTILPASIKQSRNNVFLDHLSKLRNYGYRIVISTQRVQGVSAQAVGLMLAFIVFRLTDRNAIKVMSEALSLFGVEDYEGINQSLKKYEHRDFILSL